jgi:hypothetical protein
VKKELEETKSLKHKLEAKEADIKVICVAQYCALIIQPGGKVGNTNKHIAWLIRFILFATDILVHNCSDLCKHGYDQVCVCSVEQGLPLPHADDFPNFQV